MVARVFKVVSIQVQYVFFVANLFLGDTTRNVTPQISVTPTSRQHRTHIKKTFSFQIIYQEVTQIM
jgi:hypothetical protein